MAKVPVPRNVEDHGALTYKLRAAILINHI